jgi:hypothetical protein
MISVAMNIHHLKISAAPLTSDSSAIRCMVNLIRDKMAGWKV